MSVERVAIHVALHPPRIGEPFSYPRVIPPSEPGHYRLVSRHGIKYRRCDKAERTKEIYVLQKGHFTAPPEELLTVSPLGSSPGSMNPVTRSSVPVASTYSSGRPRPAERSRGTRTENLFIGRLPNGWTESFIERSVPMAPLDNNP
jgi:hypothetical protein